MTDSSTQKVSLSKKPFYAIVCFIIDIVFTIVFFSLTIITRYKFTNNVALILMMCFSLLFFICFELIFLFSYLGRSVIIDLSKDMIICKKISGVSFKLKISNIINVEIVENKKGNKFMVIYSIRYNTDYFNPFKVKIDDGNIDAINNFIKIFKSNS